jgi:hypothetical protein
LKGEEDNDLKRLGESEKVFIRGKLRGSEIVEGNRKDVGWGREINLEKMIWE